MVNIGPVPLPFFCQYSQIMYALVCQQQFAFSCATRGTSSRICGMSHLLLLIGVFRTGRKSSPVDPNFLSTLLRVIVKNAARRRRTIVDPKGSVNKSGSPLFRM